MDRRQLLEIGGAAVLAQPLLGAEPALAAAHDIAPEVRFAIQDAQARYAWGVDSGDLALAASAFTRDATVHDMDGKRWDRAPAFVRAATAGFGTGGEHYLQLNSLDAKGKAVVAVFYWSRLTWTAGEAAPALRTLGTFTDTFVPDGRTWRIAEKRIGRWDSSTVTVHKL